MAQCKFDDCRFIIIHGILILKNFICTESDNKQSSWTGHTNFALMSGSNILSPIQ